MQSANVMCFGKAQTKTWWQGLEYCTRVCILRMCVISHLVPPLRDAVVLLLQVLAEDLGFAFAPLGLVLSGHHLLQLRVC